MSRDVDLQMNRIARCLDAIDHLSKRLKQLTRVVLLELDDVAGHTIELSETERVLTMLLRELDGYDPNLVEQAKYQTKKLK